MKNILAFAGSNSSTSINHQLVSHVVSRIQDENVKLIKLTDYSLPMYDFDVEQSDGFSENLQKLLEEIQAVDCIIISVNEHNGTVSAFFKNVIDWLTRIDYNFIEGKRLLLMSTSPGKRGGQSALEYVSGFLPRLKAEVVGSFTFPSFSENFSVENNEITNSDLDETVTKALQDLLN